MGIAAETRFDVGFGCLRTRRSVVHLSVRVTINPDWVRLLASDTHVSELAVVDKAVSYPARSHSTAAHSDITAWVGVDQWIVAHVLVEVDPALIHQRILSIPAAEVGEEEAVPNVV